MWLNKWRDLRVGDEVRFHRDRLMLVPGVAIGTAVALMLTRLARTILFGLTPSEPGVFVVAASVLAIAVVLAGWLPARRASLVDPLVALRHE